MGDKIVEVRAEQGYDGLHQAFRARADELRIKRDDIDMLASLARGHASKLLSPYPIKAIGRTTLGPLLYALKLKILVVPDDEIEWREQPSVRDDSQARAGKPLTIGIANMPEVRAIRRKVLGETMQKNGRKGGLKSARLRKAKSPEERAAIIRRGWRTRRRRERAARRATRCAPGQTEVQCVAEGAPHTP